MQQVDRLVWKELMGPFAFGVAIFTMLVFASTMLVRITEWLVAGIDPGKVIELTLLFSPAILVKTVAMSTLLSSLLAFGRLSNDSEIVALRAAGASLFRVMRPVALFAFLVAAIVFAVNETVVPAASQRASALQLDLRREIDQGKSQRQVNRTIKMNGGTTAFLNALDFSLEKQMLMDVSIIVINREGKPTWWLYADEMQYFGPKDWRIGGKAKLIPADGSTVVTLQSGLWPTQIEKPDLTPSNILAGFTSDLDVFSMKQIQAEVKRLKEEPSPDTKQINNLEFGYWNKLTGPLAAVVFALLGAPLGIRNQRTGMGSGFALSIGLVFGYTMLGNFMAVYSKGGAISPITASITPLAIGVIAAVITIARKNG